MVLAALALLSAAAIAVFYSNGWLLYYGDAEAHLNIARRMVDSRTPGYDQVGTVWLPLLHWLMLPFVRVDALWVNGLAGAIPSAIAFLLAGTFLYAAADRIFDCTSAALAADRAVRAQSQRALPAIHPDDREPSSPPACWRCCTSRCAFAIRRVGARWPARESPPARPR